MKKLWATLALATATATLVSGCAIVDDNAVTESASAAETSLRTPQSYPSPSLPVDTELIITVLGGNGMEASTWHLSCSGKQAVFPSNLESANAACAVVLSSASLFDDKPHKTDDKACTGTGNQTVADVYGESQGTHIRASFTRDNLCNAKVWDSLTPLIGLGDE